MLIIFDRETEQHHVLDHRGEVVGRHDTHKQAERQIDMIMDEAHSVASIDDQTGENDNG